MSDVGCRMSESDGVAMDSPERRPPVKADWDGIMGSPGSAAFMDLCDSLSPIRPVPTFHASTYNDLGNQMRSPPSPSFPSRRLKERRFANGSAATLLAAATSDEAPKTPGLKRREPLRQAFGRNLSRMEDASPSLKASLAATQRKQVIIQQGAGCVGDAESKSVRKASLKSEVKAQMGAPSESKHELEVYQEAGAKRTREDAEAPAVQQAPNPAFLKSLKAAANHFCKAEAAGSQERPVLETPKVKIVDSPTVQANMSDNQEAKRQKVETPQVEKQEYEAVPALEEEPSLAPAVHREELDSKIVESTAVVGEVSKLTPITPAVPSALKDMPSTEQRQTRSRAGGPMKGSIVGPILISGQLPRGKRTTVGKKKSSDSGAQSAEDAGVSSDDIERTTSMEMLPGVASVMQVEEMNAPGKGEVLTSERIVPPRAAEISSLVQEAPIRHASPEKRAVTSQLNAVRSPRKGLRKGRESLANQGLPAGAVHHNTEEDVARLLVDLSEGRTPEKAKKGSSEGEKTPISSLEVASPLDDAGAGNGTFARTKSEAATDGRTTATVSFDQAATPRLGKEGEASTPAVVGGNTGRARRLNFDADAARRQSLTFQDPRLSLEAQGSWPGFAAPPPESPVCALERANATPGIKQSPSQSGCGIAGDGAEVKPEVSHTARGLKDDPYKEAKDASQATAVALSAAMGALSACQSPVDDPDAARGPSHQLPAQSAQPGVNGPIAQAVRPMQPGVATPVGAGRTVIRNAQAPCWANPSAAPTYSTANRAMTPTRGKQGFVSPPQKYKQPMTSAPGPVTSSGLPPSSAPFDPNVAIVPKAPPPPQQVRGAKPMNGAAPSGALNLARLGAGLTAGTVVRVNPTTAPDYHSHLPGKPCTAHCRAAPSYSRQAQPFIGPRYQQYTPSYQKAPSRTVAHVYQPAGAPYGQQQGLPANASPALVQRQKMEAAFERREAQCDPLSELELDLDLDMGIMVVDNSPPQPKKHSPGCKRCHCKKSRCLKLYCECFAANVYCTGCDCVDCQNRPEFEDIVMDKKEEIERKDPNAFTPKIVEGESPSPTKGGETPASGKHKKGCHCKKSMCQKKYCECFQAGVHCTDACRCENCANEFGTKDRCRHQDPSAPAAPVEAAGSRSPVTPGFGKLSVQRTYPGAGKIVSKKHSLDSYGDDISVLDFPHHHPIKEKRPETPPKPEPATSAAPATSAKGQKREKAKSDLKTVRENKNGATEQTRSSGALPAVSSSPVRWSMTSADFSPASRFYPTPSSPDVRGNSDATDFLHLPGSPSLSFGSGSLLRTAVGGTPLSKAKIRSTPLGAVVWNPMGGAERGDFKMPESPQVKPPGGMLKLSSLAGLTPPRSAERKEGAEGQAGSDVTFEAGYGKSTGLICDESVELDPLAESFFMEPSDYDALCSYEPGELDISFGEVESYEDDPKHSVVVSPPPKTQRAGPAFVSLRNLSGGSGRHLNEDPDDPSAALLSPHGEHLQAAKRRRVSGGEVFDEATPIRMSKNGSPTKVMAPALSWRASPRQSLTATPGKKSINLSMLPPLPALPARLSGGEGSGLDVPE